MDETLSELINSGFLSQDLIEEHYASYKQDPTAVDASWRRLFDQLDAVAEPVRQTVTELSDLPVLSPHETTGGSVIYYPNVKITADNPDYQIHHLINAYRTYGHLAAQTNPLDPPEKQTPEPEQLRLENFCFSKNDLSILFPYCGEMVPLLDIINELKTLYCGRIGFEYMGVHSAELEEWLQQRIERGEKWLDIEQKRQILHHLNKSELFESFIHTKYVGQKRFSLEGAETLIPMLAATIDTGANLGIDEWIIGMAHRGRLNVLANIFNKSYANIFSEFEEGYIPASVEGSGDVKYHKGYYSDIKTVHGRQVSLTLTPNPSHLESVDPVVEGQVLARQIIRGDDIRQEKVVPILVHGDAAISGQGIVYETMQFYKLEGYATGGTIHFVVNNQIGFTTIPENSRSTSYCTDIARIFKAPVFHVNAENPEGCVFATNLAVALRQEFHCDVFVELVCYRKYGHNETDEPAFTQPLEYQMIRKKRPIREIYRDMLIDQGVMEKSVIDKLEAEFKLALQTAMQDKSRPEARNDPDGTSAVEKNDRLFQHTETGASKEVIQAIASKIYGVPEGFALHPKLAVMFNERLGILKNWDRKHPIDWGTAELLAYGSLLWNGTHIRLSGQDSCRGTFSHRHALLMDQVKERGYVPLKHLKPGQGRFDVYNSSLSEYAVLGFEFGYSIAAPKALVIWEAQFGDFSNGAQVIIDQYITTAEQKWAQKSTLTLLLPHGYEGQGPEHSSGRIERFLTLAGDNNILIANPTTPAQLFHLLRRQVLGPLNKPLIVFTPKGLLRHPACVSTIDDFTQGSFLEIMDDPHPPKKIRRLALCSGRIFYDLIAERERLGADGLSIVRVEQLYPLDVETIKTVVRRCADLKECIWVQEEPSNMGAWGFMRPILRDLLPKEVSLAYIGRTRSASPAVGSYAVHKKEHAAILKGLFETENPSIFEMKV
ncbi:MAG: 2-oxoglutarate dehydrogenase E1 component [Parachlamydiaceae bacterium]